MLKTGKKPVVIIAFILMLTGVYTYRADEVKEFVPQIMDYEPDHIWPGPDGKPLPFDTVDDIIAFLATAEPIQSETIRSGVMRPKKMLFKKDGVEINAIFRHQSRIDNSPSTDSGTAKGQRYFRDCCKSEIAAFEINRLLGLNNMPPTICRVIKKKGHTPVMGRGDHDRKGTGQGKETSP